MKWTGRSKKKKKKKKKKRERRKRGRKKEEKGEEEEKEEEEEKGEKEGGGDDDVKRKRRNSDEIFNQIATLVPISTYCLSYASAHVLKICCFRCILSRNGANPRFHILRALRLIKRS